MTEEESELRDRVAIAALTVIMARPVIGQEVEDMADIAYDIADAMIARRNWEPQDPMDADLQDGEP